MTSSRMSFLGWHWIKSGRSRWKAFVIVPFALLFLAEVHLLIRQERSQVAGAKAQKLGFELIDFAQARAEGLQRQAHESIGPYEQRVSRENAATESLYSEKYYKEVAYLQQALTHRGLRDPEFDVLCQRPGSVLGVRDVGKRLFEMGAILRSRTLLGAIASQDRQ